MCEVYGVSGMECATVFGDLFELYVDVFVDVGGCDVFVFNLLYVVMLSEEVGGCGIEVLWVGGV